MESARQSSLCWMDKRIPCQILDGTPEGFFNYQQSVLCVSFQLALCSAYKAAYLHLQTGVQVELVHKLPSS